MLAAPTPTISRSPSTSAPVLSANTDAVEMVSVRETREMPSAPAKSKARSPSGTVGMVNGGNPDGSAPTRATSWSSRLNTATAAIARRTAARTLGKIGPQALEDQDQRQTCHADRERSGDCFASLDRLDEGDGFVDQAVGVNGEPEQLGELADEDGEREAVHVPDLGRLREQVSDEAELEHSGEHRDRADHEREHRRIGHSGLGTAVGGHERDKGGSDHRTEG